MPLVSVIIPNYNHASFLKQRIDSVLNQTFVDFEIIILDDCSTDNSREVIETYRENRKIKTIVYNEANSGSPFKQWKKGIDLAEGEYVWIAESDDWAYPRFLEKLIAAIAQFENVGICFSGSNWIDDNGKTGKDLSLYHKDFFRTGREEIKNSLIKFNTIQNASAALMQTALAQKYIAKTVRYKSSGDWSLYLNILQESNILFVNEKLNHFRWYHNNVSKKASLNGRWIIEGLKILAASGGCLHFSKKEVSGISHEWLRKPDHFSSFRFLYLKGASYYYVFLFIIKCRFYNFISSK